jgi:hypothetical protein
MDEVRIVRRRTYVWPAVIAVIVLALVIAFVLFMNRTGANTIGWNGMMQWPIEAVPSSLT